jgi:NAD(P)-dependent dehydrogenase (short-subunit alcohol dehydrogenase family)
MKKNVIVTGGAQGIGKTVSLSLIEQGFAVSVFEIDKEAIDEFRLETGNKDIAFYTVDVANEAEVKNATEQSFSDFGNIYGLVNNAAISINKNIIDLSFEEWKRVIDINLSGAFLCAKYASPFLKTAKGRIVNMASTRAIQSEANTEAYSASKGGILALTHALAASLGPQVKVNSISPGWIDVSAAKKKANAKQEMLTPDDHRQHPAGRVGKADDISNMVLFLLAAENDFITGQNFVIDGGMTSKMIYV